MELGIPMVREIRRVSRGDEWRVIIHRQGRQIFWAKNMLEVPRACAGLELEWTWELEVCPEL